MAASGVADFLKSARSRVEASVTSSAIYQQAATSASESEGLESARQASLGLLGELLLLSRECVRMQFFSTAGSSAASASRDAAGSASRTASTLLSGTNTHTSV